MTSLTSSHRQIVVVAVRVTTCDWNPPNLVEMSAVVKHLTGISGNFSSHYATHKADAVAEAQPNASQIADLFNHPGPRHWDNFRELSG